MNIDRLKIYLLFFICNVWQLSLFPMQAVYKVDGVRFKLCKGDITQQCVDVIVNAANGHMLGGAGVDGAIHKAAGPGLLKYNMNLPFQEIDGKKVRCQVGQVVITPSFDLKNVGISYIIHANGPHGTMQKRAGLLTQCYQQAIETANKLKINCVPVSSIAFPVISVGIFGYPKQEAIYIAVGSVMGIVHQLKTQGRLNLNEVCFVIYDHDTAVEELCTLYMNACNYFADRIEMQEREIQGLGKVKAVIKNISVATWQKGVSVLQLVANLVRKPMDSGLSYIGAATHILAPWFSRG